MMFRNFDYFVEVSKGIGKNYLGFTDKAYKVKRKTKNGEKVTLYRLYKLKKDIDLEEHGISEEDMRLFKRGRTTKLGFNLIVRGEDLTFLKLNDEELNLTPIDIEDYNFLREMYKLIHDMTVKKKGWGELAPVVGVAFAALLFILVLIFFPEHMEALADKMLSFGSRVAVEKMSSVTGGQVIPPA